MDPATIYGIITGTIGLVSAIRGVLAELRGRYKRRNVSEKCNELDALLNNKTLVLNQLKKCEEESITRRQKNQVKGLERFSAHAQSYLQQEIRYISKLTPTERRRRTRRVSEWLDEVAKILRKLEIGWNRSTGSDSSVLVSYTVALIWKPRCGCSCGQRLVNITKL